MAIPRWRVEGNDEDLVHLYLTDIGKYPLLTKDDEVRLAQQIEQGTAARAEMLNDDKTLTPTTKRALCGAVRDGEVAQRVFVESNLRLVVSIARRYRTSELPFLDLIQEGNVGLIHAVNKFDWRKGFKFSTYATPLGWFACHLMSPTDSFCSSARVETSKQDLVDPRLVPNSLRHSTFPKPMFST